jgi:cytochrome c oxidase cbb3-type subunit 3
MHPNSMHPNTESSSSPPADPLTGHEYDGIAEYDNPMPIWWRRIFWATFVFSIGYYVHYQLTGNGASVEQTYAAEMQEHREKLAAAALGQQIDEEALARLMADPLMMKDAASIYKLRCVQCHADRGQGNIGPNLTDDHWIYGSASLMDLFEIITNGRPQKGMPVWSRTLRPVEMAQVAAYVGTLRNTNVPGRPPQGTRLANVTTAAAVHVATSPAAASSSLESSP